MNGRCENDHGPTTLLQEPVIHPAEEDATSELDGIDSRRVTEERLASVGLVPAVVLTH